MFHFSIIKLRNKKESIRSTYHENINTQRTMQMNDCYEVWHLNIMNGQYADVTVFAIVGNKCLIFAPFYTSIFYVK